MSVEYSFNPITINEQFCNGCGNCVFLCPMGVIEIQEKPGSNKGKIAVASKTEYCLLCETCVKGCKRKAITFNEESESLFIDQLNDTITE